MAENREIIKVIVQGAKKSEKQLKGVNARLMSMAKKAGLAAGAYFGARGLIEGFNALTEQGSKLQSVSKAFGNMSTQSGLTANALQKFRKATNNTVDDVTLMTKANNAMALGLVQGDEQFADLLDTAQRLGAALGQDVTQSLDSLVTGMGRQSKLMLDNLGIMVDTNLAYDKYAEKLGISTSALDDNQKKIAFNEEAMFQAKKIVGEMGAEQETAAMKTAELSATFANMTSSIGAALSPALTELTETFVVAAQAVSEFFLRQTESETQTAIRNLKEMGVNTAELELSYVRLQKNTAMKDLNIGIMELGSNQDAIKDNNKEIADLAQEELDRQQNRIALEQEILEITNGEMALQDHINLLIANREGHEDRSRINQLERLENQRQEFEESEANTQAKIEALELENEKRTELETLKINEAALEGQILETQNKKNENLVSSNKLVESSNAALQKANEETAKKTIIDQEKITKATIEGKKKIASSILAAAGIQNAEDTKEGIRTAYGMAGEAYKAMAGIPIIGPALGVAAAVAAFTLGMGYVKKMTTAQYGADFITDGPQMMMVGEGRGPERVQVTPLEDPNLEGPQGQGITLNISGNVLHESFIEDEVIPQIREGLRLGENMGI